MTPRQPRDKRITHEGRVTLKAERGLRMMAVRSSDPGDRILLDVDEAHQHFEFIAPDEFSMALGFAGALLTGELVGMQAAASLLEVSRYAIVPSAKDLAKARDRLRASLMRELDEEEDWLDIQWQAKEMAFERLKRTMMVVPGLQIAGDVDVPDGLEDIERDPLVLLSLKLMEVYTGGFPTQPPGGSSSGSS